MGNVKVQLLIFSCVIATVAAQPIAAATAFGNVQTIPQPSLQPPVLATATPFGNGNVQTIPQPFGPAATTPFGNVQTNIQTNPQLFRLMASARFSNVQTIPQPSMPAFNFPTTQTGFPSTTQQPNNNYYTQLYNKLGDANQDINYYTEQIDQVLSKAEKAPLKCMYEVKSKLTEMNKVTQESMYYIQTNQLSKLDLTAIHDALSGPVLHRDLCFKVTWVAVRKLAKPSPKITEIFGDLAEGLKKLDTVFDFVRSRV